MDPHGVRSSTVHRIARGVYREIKPWPKAQRERFLTELWKSGKLEEGVIACHAYRRFAKDFGAGDFRTFDRWLERYVHNWANCDGLAGWLVAGAIRNRPELIAKLDGWTRSKNRWRRRAAIVTLLQEAKAGGNTAAIFRICTLLRGDADVMVQKGVGWVLKETYPAKPREVRKFLRDWRATAPRLLLRIAAEKMTPKDRAWLLTK